ncbi:MAG: Rieske (2Fe-2S) protein, partial [Nocardiopsaceae bacterium]|nr:Rieske (2Fe-2S) protein [Nocardiopsaceae bacterium]
MVSQNPGDGVAAPPAAPPPAVDPAPLDPAAVAESLQPFGRSRMLPRAAYVDQAVFEWEQRHFFGGWVCLGRSEQLPAPGDMRAEATGAGSVLLVRDEAGSLRGFANTCRHRGHELLPCGSAGRQRVIICPYHGWTYALDGGLRAAAGFKNRPGFDAAQWGLAELPVTEWHGLVFADGSGRAAPLAGSLGGLAGLVASYELERLVTAGQHDYEV